MNGVAPLLLDAWIENFNLKQTEAYEFDGHCAVLAGPGSGKTRVLAARVARLYSQRVKGPRGIACITFSHEAVRELRNRLRKLGLNPDRRLFIGTVHSFCLTCIVTPFSRLFFENLDSALGVAGEIQQEQTFQTVLADEGLNGNNRELRRQFDEFRKVHRFKNDGIRHEESDIARLVGKYESVLRKQCLLDFDGIVHVALDLIRHHSFVRSALEARFPFLVVDEYQDLGYPLHLIVETLMRETEIEVFAVGDPDQSIYGFTGADPKYLRNLAKDSRVHWISLNMNYRSTQQIIEGSQVALSPEKPRKYVSARDDEEGEIRLLECPNGLRQQAEVIATKLIPYLEQKGVPHSQIAILYIDRWDVQELSRALNESGIQYAGRRDQRYLRTPFTRWLEDIAAWCSLYPQTQRGPRFDDLFFQYAKACEEAGTSANTGDLTSRVEFFEAITSVAMPDRALHAWLRQLDSLLGLEGLLQARKAHPDDWAGWKSVLESCADGKHLAGKSLNYFSRCGDKSDTVTLTTLHSSKGLEFEVAIMPGLEEGRLPRFSAETEEAVAEARRVFYVGMTRAKDSIYLLFSGWYTNRYNREFRNGPSRFILELKSEAPPIL